MSWKDSNGCHLLMMVIILSLGIINFFWGELVPAGGGLGWDGVTYSNLTKNLPTLISNGELNGYYSHRILPSLIVRVLMDSFNLPFLNNNIIKAYQIYNLLLLIASCFIWKSIANHYSLSIGGRWLGFGGVFINFSVSKQAFYYPVLTDVTAIFLGLLLVDLYSRKKTSWIFFTTIIGAFVWPLFSLFSSILLIFSKFDSDKSFLDRVVKPLPSFLSFFPKSILFSLIGILASISFFKVMKISNPVINWHNRDVVLDLPNIFGSFFTGAPSLLLVLFAIFTLIGDLSYLKRSYKYIKQSFKLIFLSVLAFLIIYFIVEQISNPALSNPNSIVWTVYHLFLPDNGKLLLAFLTLIIFWGPILILAMLNWDRFCQEIRYIGPGAVYLICLTLPLSLITEPRYITLSWPFVVLGVTLIFEKIETCKSFNYVYSFFTIFYAQFWMKINLGVWSQEDYEGLLEFPKQLYFMHYGFWMGWPAYIIQSLFVVMTIYVLNRKLLISKNNNDIVLAN